MKLSATIMAHPVRKAEAEELQATLDRPVEIIYDTNPEPSKDPAQRWRTGRRAWEEHDPDADWHMVIQDDALAAADLVAGLEAALDVLGTKGLVSAYTGTGRPDQRNVKRALAYADQHGHSWMSTRSLNWGVAILAPVDTITDMLAWCTRRGGNYDYRVGRYYRDVLGWRTWYTVPSLVEHRGLPSLVGHGAGGDRVAHRFLGTNTSALGIDWTKTPRDGLTVGVA